MGYLFMKTKTDYCKVHPYYQAKQAPRVECEPCWVAWREVRKTVPLYDEPRGKEKTGSMIGYLDIATGRIYTPKGKLSEQVRQTNTGSFHANSTHAKRVEAALRYVRELEEELDETDTETENSNETG